MQVIRRRAREAETSGSGAEKIGLAQLGALGVLLHTVNAIKLDRLAQAAGFPPETLRRWAVAGLVRAHNAGVGRGNGYSLTREAALEAAALMVLRHTGVPLQRLRVLARTMRERGKQGSDFLAVGANGRAWLVDGAGADAPLRDPRTGQLTLGLVFDLRRLRPQLQALVDELAESPA